MDQEQEKRITDKLDHIASLLSDEVNIHPDTIRDNMSAWQVLPFGISDLPLTAIWFTSTRESSRYLTLQLKDQTGTVVFYRTWKFVYEDWNFPGHHIDKVGE